MSAPGVRLAVIGGGSQIFEAAHAPAIADLGAEVVGLFDAAPARAAAVGGRFGWPVAADFDALLATGADAAVVCVPHPLHAGFVTACATAGLDVLVEKPLAGTLGEIDDIIRAAEASGVLVAVLQQHRLRDEVVAARAMLTSGELGRIHRAVLTASYPKRSNYYTDTAWRGTWAGEGGGVLLNQGLHDIDLLQHLLGMPERVWSTQGTALHPIEAEDTADVVLTWPDGATGSVHVTSAAALEENRLEIFGSAGDIRITGRGLEVRPHGEDFAAFAATPGGHLDLFPRGEWELRVAPGHGTHRDVYADFFAAREHGGAPVTPAADARGAVEIIAAAAISHDIGTAVALPVDPARQDALLQRRIEEAAHERVG
ncbi:Gfo/Idh/MocA family protein [Microbacterium thalassium]|uniref:Putative dehydrogenase n=1 Tax=Microbacterium thalassium TaxID=362649 RepID=A0A7X0KU06_9MICO|nr:Gfo/Idh/MocA family oxidoreductase [Microbacterium thalassium]MBB6390634.1 putative dehydrogenase [Microbacterium thalassium]GLK25743.1 oxidoreductase [Microbacterium thalassium]